MADQRTRATRNDEADRGPGFKEVSKVIQAHGGRLRGLPGVIAVRPGYRFEDGWITNQPAIVLAVHPDALADPSQTEGWPRAIDGVPVDLAPATPIEQLRALPPEPGLRKVVGVGPPIKAPEDDLALPGGDQEPPAVGEAAAEERAPTRPYKPPPKLKLNQVVGAMSLICHCSPDAGFPTLKPFLEEVKERLTVAMYDFTAPHIARSLQTGMVKTAGDLDLNLDPGLALGNGGSGDNPKANDIDEVEVRERLASKLGERFKFTWAAVRVQGKTSGGIFPSAYHIKVAVRDGKAFWLSSGNWQSTNQPDLDPIGKPKDQKGIFGKYNREWHVVVNHPGLAGLYEKFIQWDIEQAAPFQEEVEEREAAVPLPELLVPIEPEERAVARFFKPRKFTFTKSKPLTIQPVLTPDNYAKIVLKMIESAERSIYFQNQYIHVNKKNSPGFDALVDALLARIKAGLDVRIILRDIGDARKMLEALQFRGFDMAVVKLQKGCHNKGIIVDSKVVALGSHNWSSDGTTANRDATLIIHDPDVAAYYEQVFLYDWENQARQKSSTETHMPVVVRPGEVRRRDVGVVAIPWSSYFED